MKKNLFLLVMGLLSSLSLFAQPDSWNDPTGTLTKTTTIVADGSTVYYLKNEAVQNWFVAGNNWWTQACVVGPGKKMPETSPYGHQVRFSDPDTYEGYYRISDMSPDGLQVKNSWVQLFDNKGTIYSDTGDKDEKTYWKLTFDGDKNFTFVSHLKPNDLVGLVSDDGVNPKVTPAEEGRGPSSSTGDYTMNNTGTVVATTWSLWSLGEPNAVAEWNAVVALWDRMTEIFDESVEKFDVSTYNDQIGEQKGTLENAERLTALLATLNADYMAWQIENATPENPADVTSKYITNPDFETGNTTGWTYTKSDDHGAKSTANDTYKMSNSSGAYLFNIWSVGNEISQTIEALPAGVYKLTAVMATDAGHDLVLSAGEKSASVVSTDKGTGLLVELPFVAEEGNEGFKISAKTADKCWYKVDNFKLYYTGNSAESYAATFIETYKDKASYMYQQGLAGKVTALKAATGDAVKTAYEEAKAYEDGDVAENVAAWAKYNDLCADASILATDKDFSQWPEAGELAAMVADKLQINNIEADASTTDLNAGYDAILAKMNELRDHIQPGTDITKTYLKNADFTQGLATDPTKGWVIEGTRTDGCNWRIRTEDKCGECWNGKDFDFYQIVENAPVGVYQIEVQGFTRAYRGNASWYFYFDANTGELLPEPVFGDWTPNKANVYLNDNTGDLSISYAYGHTLAEGFFTKTDVYKDPFESAKEGTGKIYPDGMGSAGESFAKGEYTKTAFGLVAKKGDPLRIGVKGNNYGLDNWAIFANFKLVYQGFEPTIIKPEFQKAVDALGEAHIGTELQEEQNALKAEAAGTSTSDGKAMFAVLSKIYEFNTRTADSEEVFAELHKQTENLTDEMTKYKETATDKAMKAAQKLRAKAVNAYEDVETYLPTVTTEAAQGIIEEFAPVLEALKVNKNAGSDADPSDFTAVIQNANMASDKGWTSGEEDTKKVTIDATNKVAEFFDSEKYNVYQKISGLPEGLYEVQVRGFYRGGAIAEDWPLVAAGTDSYAMLYAINDNQTLKDEDPETEATEFYCPLRHVSTEAIDENPGQGRYASIEPFAEQGDKTPWYMPDDLVSAAYAFGEDDFYVNKIYIYIWGTADTLTIGIKKDGPKVTKDWCAFSNWKLIGYGNESVKKEGAQTQSCTPVTPQYNMHYPLTALIAEATTYYESIANKEEYQEVAAELQGAINTAKQVDDNTEATQEDINTAVKNLQDALDAAKKATSISEVGAKANKALANGKYFKKGQLYIVKNGKIYTATGSIVK